ncbi:hypothetical protein V5O48_005303 [Marasmius crinis-equi]|uniref:Uncharacterized protein n=1 Tax=Marasmius crinis-equi TaxID=585013 RepID=A0ABR3FMX5_9AGAR
MSNMPPLVSSFALPRFGLPRELLTVRKDLVELSGPFYLPTVNMGSLRWSRTDGSNTPAFVIYKDWSEAERRFDTDFCTAEKAFLRDRKLIDDEAEESNSLGSEGDEDSISDETDQEEERQLVSDICTDHPVEFVVLAKTARRARTTRHVVLEAIQEDSVLRNDFEVAVATLADLCHLDSKEGWAVDAVVLNGLRTELFNSTKIVVRSSSITCAPGSVVEASFTLGRTPVPMVRKERFTAELTSIRVHAPPEAAEVVVSVSEPEQDSIPRKRRSKRARRA